MKKENSNFFKLISVIIVLLLIVIIGILTMPRMEEAREKAFRVEATRIIDAAKRTFKDYNSGKINLKNNSTSCKKNNEICFKISELSNLKYYKASSSDYIGKVVIDASDNNNVMYYLYLKKSADLRIIGGFREDYVNMGTLSIEDWEEEYETCNCE